MRTLGVFAAIFDDERRILCVKRGYPPHNWALPGGGVDPGESVLAAFAREVLEETGIVAEAGPLIGVYHAPFRNDTVFFHVGRVREHGAWEPDGEIVEQGWFTFESLPPDLSIRTRVRIEDAFRGRRGIVRDFVHEGDAVGRINEVCEDLTQR
jgi:ADP-ribose pyrophosphatase YjhB (NUDIX family)